MRNTKPTPTDSKTSSIKQVISNIFSHRSFDMELEFQFKNETNAILVFSVD